MVNSACLADTNQKHTIQEPLLRSAIEGGSHGLAHLPEFSRHDHWNHGTGQLAHLFLIFLVRLEFDLQRIPGFGDRMYTDYELRSDANEFFAKLTDEDIANSRHALREIYLHTQSFLKNQQESKRIHNGSVYLGRGVKHEYALQIKFDRDRALANHDKHICIRTDTVSSYSYGSVGYTDGLRFWRWLPFEQVLMTDKNVTCLCEDEWLVINPDPRGIVNIMIDEIKVEPGYAGHRLEVASQRYADRRDFLVDEFERYDRPISHIRLNSPWVRDGKIVYLAKKVEQLLQGLMNRHK